MGLSKLNKKVDPTAVAHKLREKNAVYLSNDKVKLDQLVMLVKKLQDALPSASKTASRDVRNLTFVLIDVGIWFTCIIWLMILWKFKTQLGLAGVDYDTFNLNKLNNEELQKHKDAMEQGFLAHQKKPGDPGYQ